MFWNLSFWMKWSHRKLEIQKRPRSSRVCQENVQPPRLGGLAGWDCRGDSRNRTPWVTARGQREVGMPWEGQHGARSNRHANGMCGRHCVGVEKGSIVGSFSEERLEAGWVQLSTLPHHTVCIWYISPFYIIYWNLSIRYGWFSLPNYAELRMLVF